MAPVLSGVVTVTTAGTAVQFPANGPGEYLIKADPANTGYIYVGNDGAGDVASGNGYKLAAGDVAAVSVSTLSNLWADASVNGEKVTFLKIGPIGRGVE